jgi:hypothetical protein
VSRSEESKLRRSVQIKILESLRFPTTTSRYESVVEAYPETFEWAYGDSSSKQRPWSNLAKWMREVDGIYWINGKAGSGKSTLMKHIYDDARTQRLLENWAQQAPPHAAPLCRIAKVLISSGVDLRYGVNCSDIGRIPPLEFLTKYLMPKFPKDTADHLAEMKRQLEFKKIDTWGHQRRTRREPEGCETPSSQRLEDRRFILKVYIFWCTGSFFEFHNRSSFSPVLL